KKFGKDYFDELLERIREIRASERRAYQKIADIFEQCSADYDPTAETTRLFYAFVQNKMHYAVTGQTAAEIVYKRANSKKPYMGLTTWKNAPHGKVMKSDVAIAKNYLSKHEINLLNRLVTAFIDFAELRALNRKITTMQEWLDRTNEFLKFAEQPILKSAGQISHEQALKKAMEEYEIFREKQDHEYFSYFDSVLEKYLKGTSERRILNK
ncbi:MAG: virulence RhuM family protein, partial [Prevotellaceae bacterium]|nr:virulence RhuM family protein [Prevotellaceae bacterium]